MPVSDEIMSRMAQVPQQLEILKQREIERRTIHPGDKVRIGSGPLEGWIVDISEVHAGIARFVLPLLGSRAGSASVETLHKIVAPHKAG